MEFQSIVVRQAWRVKISLIGVPHDIGPTDQKAFTDSQPQGTRDESSTNRTIAML